MGKMLERFGEVWIVGIGRESGKVMQGGASSGSETQQGIMFNIPDCLGKMPVEASIKDGTDCTLQIRTLNKTQIRIKKTYF